eukprot:1266522-Pyramimonas_sp.AAC.1
MDVDKSLERLWVTVGILWARGADCFTTFMSSGLFTLACTRLPSTRQERRSRTRAAMCGSGLIRFCLQKMGMASPSRCVPSRPPLEPLR